MNLNNNELQNRAREFALTNELVRTQRTHKQFLSGFRSSSRHLQDFATHLGSERATCKQPAEDWLLDHATFLDIESQEIERLLSKSTFNALPILQGRGVPRIYALCEDYLQHVDGRYEVETFEQYVMAYQEISVLHTLECWMLPVLMRVALISSLATQMREVQHRHEVCAAISSVFDYIKLKETTNEAVRQRLDEYESNQPLSPVAIVHFVRHLGEQNAHVELVHAWLAAHIERSEHAYDQMVSYEHQFQAELQVRCGNLVTSLHTVNRRPWRATLTKISYVEQAFLTDTQAEFAKMDLSSRDLIRNRVADLARRMKVPETLVAKTALSLAREAQSELSHQEDVAQKNTHFAYYLFHPGGMQALQRAINRVVHTRRFLRLPTKERPLGTFLGTLSAMFVVCVVVASLFVTQGGFVHMSVWAWIAVIAVLALPMSEWAFSMLHLCLERLLRPTPLLRYDFSETLPDDARTMVVMPIIWSGTDEVDDVIDRLEVHYLANRQKNIHFAVLADFTDAPQASMPGDDTILSHATAKIKALCKTYGEDKFFLFHRSRRYNETDNVFMGWERKRGKLVEFAALLGGDDQTTFSTVVGRQEILSDIRYLFTVDHDTRLPMGTVGRMAGTIHYPYYRPIKNSAGTRVVAGFGILQPRVAMSYDSAQKSRFAKLWAGEPGIDPYAFAASNPYQDLFGQVAFVGKGIFDVEMFRTLLADRVPDNHVLSHDLLEGGILRTGFVSDVEVIEDYPTTVYAHSRRTHRWIRGDWQLFHWLRHTCKNRQGDVVANDLCGLTRFQIIDNMRKSLLFPALFVVAWLGLGSLPGHVAVWEGIVVATIFLPFWRAVIATILSPSEWGKLAVAFGQSAVQLLCLPFACVVHLDAVVRVLYRMGISHRKLLEWVPAERTNQHLTRHAVFVQEWLGYTVVALFAVTAWLFTNPLSHLFGTVGLCIWIAAHPIMRKLGRTIPSHIHEWVPGARQQLETWSKQIWAFYETYVTDASSWLPPDNVQYQPEERIAHRTSPTNIGLYLMCVVAARDLGLIDNEEMTTRLERTMHTVCRLTKWNGHLLNWYDTQNGSPLLPRYVSTVDSGNFVAHLMVVRQALLETVECREDTRLKLDTLGRTMQQFIEDTDFSALYDNDNHLFSLGFHVDENRKETILYDLLASEARQASFVAIALGQIPVSHWFALGRAMTMSRGYHTLLSWSGTMFEYLMPSLIMRTYKATVWDFTYQGVVREQVAYADKRHVPFGISESGYYAFDYQMNYQYRAFGVPALALDRGMERNLVVAPYATIMALPLASDESLLALHRLEQFDAKGAYGFYEAVDFTAQRLPKGSRHQVIQSFMAHHQGMSMITLANLLCRDMMIERFHAIPCVRAAELLLQERIPKAAAVVDTPWDRQVKPPQMSPGQRDVTRVFHGDTELPEVTVLSNGRMTSVLTNRGNAMLTWNGLAVTRWREDSVIDTGGPVLYIHDVHEEETWTPTRFPMRLIERQKTVFGLDKVSFAGEYRGIATNVDIAVASDADVEIRKLTVTNLTDDTKTLEVTSFLELALADQGTDVAHPAFSKLFVETSHDVEDACLIAKRRPRDEDETETFAVHALYSEIPAEDGYEFETDRATFIGRGHTLENPRGLREKLRGTVGAVADPAFVLRRSVRLEAKASQALYMLTGVAQSRDEAIRIVRQFRQQAQVEQAFYLAWIRSQIDLRHLSLLHTQAMDAMKLATRALYSFPLRDERLVAIRDNVLGQAALWSRGLSGDAPIVTIAVDHTADLPFVTLLVQQHQYLCSLGLAIDLVILDETESSYADALMHQLRDKVAARGVPEMKRAVGIKADQLNEQEKILLQAVSRVWLRANGPSLSAQLGVPDEPSIGQKVVRQRNRHSASVPVMARPLSLARRNGVDGEFANGLGRFVEDGTEYEIEVRDEAYLPRPWSNVIANPDFGFVVTELGSGYSWWRNSRECKLTPWSNDPVLDPVGECIYLRDVDTDEVWSATPKPAGDGYSYRVTHGQGYTRFEQVSGSVRHRLELTVPMDAPVKVMKLTLENTLDTVRRIAVTSYVEWVLGVKREAEAPYIVTEWDASICALVAKNTYQSTFREANAFLHIGGRTEALSAAPLEYSWTGDRRAFMGAPGLRSAPDGLWEEHLNNQAGAFANSCGAVQTVVEIPPQGTTTVTLLLGCAASRDEVAQLVQTYGHSSAYDETIASVNAHWSSVLTQIQVKTPDRAMDVLLNRWLLYQALSCRLWARTAFYQAGGAYGFRDQLQDALALLHTRPDITRQQILHNAAHQYEEGDVQHWWHEDTHKGIRTRYADDLLWLPYAVARYIEHTADTDILQEDVPFLHSVPLKEDEAERYEDTVVSSETGTLLDHCLRAIVKSMRFGEHGIPLMGIGDWNDGMNRVGAKGRGESVWLGFFLLDILQRFTTLGGDRIAPSTVDLYRREADELRNHLNHHAWDGGWFRRAFTDDGFWLGSREDHACKIDAIAQSWAVISAGSTEERKRRAMRAFERELVDKTLQVAKLLAPPFDEMKPSPGYIQGYPPGIRENGGQYTHGVIWSVVAWALLDEGDKAWQLFSMLNPITHTQTPREVAVYGNEPYVMSADVYTAPPHEGRAGWSWYTGAAGWMYQAGVESILGVRRKGNQLILEPCVPVDWPAYQVQYRFGDSLYVIEVDCTKRDTTVPMWIVDGQEVREKSLALIDDGQTHHVEYHLSRPSATGTGG